MLIKPLGFHVFVKALPTRKMVGSIVLPDTSSITQRIGVVTAVGRGFWKGDKFVPTEVQVGDKVVFGMYSGQQLKFVMDVDDKITEDIYYHMREEEIYCILEGADDEIVSVEDVVG